MEINQLIQFQTIAKTSNLTKAADELHISQPALSISIKKLENELGIQLFERKKNKIILNDNGKIALEYASQIINQVNEMKRQLDELVHHELSLRIGFSDPGPLWYCAPLFSSDHPDYELTTEQFNSNESLYDLLINNKYDLIISDLDYDHNNIECIPFLEDHILLSVPIQHPLSKEDSLSFYNLTNTEISMLYVGGSFYAKQKEIYDSLKKNISIKLFTDFFLFSQTVKKNNSLTISTKLVSQYRDDGDNRKLINITDVELKTVYKIYYLKGNKSTVKPFIDWAHTIKNI